MPPEEMAEFLVDVFGKCGVMRQPGPVRFPSRTRQGLTQPQIGTFPRMDTFKCACFLCNPFENHRPLVVSYLRVLSNQCSRLPDPK